MFLVNVFPAQMSGTMDVTMKDDGIYAISPA